MSTREEKSFLTVHNTPLCTGRNRMGWCLLSSGRINTVSLNRLEQQHLYLIPREESKNQGGLQSGVDRRGLFLRRKEQRLCWAVHHTAFRIRTSASQYTLTPRAMSQWEQQLIFWLDLGIFLVRFPTPWTTVTFKSAGRYLEFRLLEKSKVGPIGHLLGMLQWLFLHTGWHTFSVAFKFSDSSAN